jgi:gliding motility-associated protein GldC
MTANGFCQIQSTNQKDNKTMGKSKITFDIDMDVNNVPESINWDATDTGDNGVADAVMISMWDKNEKNTLKIDLWTKNMMVDEMKMMLHQTMLTLSDTFERATGDIHNAEEIREFAQRFGENVGIVKKG